MQLGQSHPQLWQLDFLLIFSKKGGQGGGRKRAWHKGFLISTLVGKGGQGVDISGKTRTAVMLLSKKRASARVRDRRHYARRRRNAAVCRVEYNGRTLGRLITLGWLPEREVIPSEMVADAIMELLDQEELPRRK